MVAARERMLTWGRDALAAAEAARDVALAHYPALPLPMIAEAVAAVVPDPLGLGGGAGAGQGAAGPVADGWRPVGPDDVAQSITYALRFDERGKPRRTGSDHLAPLAATHLVRCLALAGFVVVRQAPGPLDAAAGA